METAQRLVSTRRGTILLSVLAAAVAGGLILVYVNRYRDSVKAAGAPVTVLVAKVNITKGTGGSQIATTGLYSTTTLRQSQVLDGAFSDTSSLTGKVATTDIPQGAQLTSADFAAAASNLTASLTGTQRVDTPLPFNSAQGLSGALQTGDHVDVYGGFNVLAAGPNGLAAGGGSRPVVRRILTNVPVVAIGGSTSGSFATSSTNLSFKVTDQQAADLAFASQNGTLWLGLEPSAGVKSSRPSVVTMETLLLGVPPSTVLRSLGGRR